MSTSDPDTPEPTPDVRAALRGELRQRMRARDKVAVQVIRTALAAIENAEAQPLPSPGATELQLAPAGPAEVDRRVVTDGDARAIVAVEVDELVEAARGYRAVGQDAAADTVDAQAVVLREVLAGS